MKHPTFAILCVESPQIYYLLPYPSAVKIIGLKFSISTLLRFHFCNCKALFTPCMHDAI